jgi:hypothetical protein
MNDEASPILLNAICAISARYSKNYATQTPADSEMESNPVASLTQHYTSRATAYSGDVFAQKAKSQALKVLSVSDLDVCAALMILSWNEFGCDRDTVSEHQVLQCNLRLRRLTLSRACGCERDRWTL